MKTNQPVEQNTDLLKEALEFSFDGVWVYDENERVVYVNSQGLKYNNTSLEEVLGYTFRQIKDKGIFTGSAAKMAFEEKRVSTQEILNNTGQHLLCTATPIFDSNGRVRNVVTNVRDFTQLFNLAEELREKANIIEEYKTELENMRRQNMDLFVAESPKMRTLVNMADCIAATDVTILLLGESGVGKSEMARYIHNHSPRADKEIVIANCGAIPATLLESEFFGYEKGAFTGASTAKKGLFETANGSTLMLDEIGELEPAMQVKLLRILQEGKLRRLGGNKEIKVDVRIIAATNRDLQQMVHDGSFRDDLYYRINRVPMIIPPLRERKEDLRRFIGCLLERYNTKYNRHKILSANLLNVFENYIWPGNIRELDNLMERLVLLVKDDIITSDHIPADMVANEVEEVDYNKEDITLKQAVEDVERRVLAAARKRHGDMRSMASALGVSHVTIARKLKYYGLS